MSVWGGAGSGGGGLLLSVLREVFLWLSAPQLVAAAAVCREWRLAALEPTLWRHLLEPLAPHGALRALAAHSPLGVEWREEYVRVCGAWEQRGLILGAAPLVHAALSDCGTRLAAVDELAGVTVWIRQHDEWARAPSWACDMRESAGWAGGERAQWPPRGCERLLVTGRVALAERWELAVLSLGDALRVECRAGCSPGAAGCWAGSDAFVSLELRLLGVHGVTAAWLNAAWQRVADEHAGVAAPLLRIYNEARAHLTHAVVVEDSVGGGRLVASCGEAGDAGRWGVATALTAWALPALAPAAVVAHSSLPERLARRRASRAPPEPESEPDEFEVRALCTPPTATCSLGARVVGLTLQPDSCCLWASTVCHNGAVRMVCVLVASLQPLRELSAPPAPSMPLEAHYVQPAASESLVGSPAGAGSGLVWLWGTKSGARRPAPLSHPAPALALLLPPSPSLSVLVLTPQALHVSMATSLTLD